MTKLLSDEELREEVVKAIVSDTHIHIGGHYPDGTPIDEESAVDDILALINTQKRLFAESVIGDDESRDLSGDNYSHILHQKQRNRNELRAEQKARMNL